MDGSVRIREEWDEGMIEHLIGMYLFCSIDLSVIFR